MKKKKVRKGKGKKEIYTDAGGDKNLNNEVAIAYQEVYGNNLRKKILGAMTP